MDILFPYSEKSISLAPLGFFKLLLNSMILKNFENAYVIVQTARKNNNLLKMEMTCLYIVGNEFDYGNIQNSCTYSPHTS